MALEDCGERRAEIGGDREVALLIEPRRCRGPASPHKCGPLYGAAEHPDHVAVPVVSPAIAVLADGAAELGQHEDDSVAPSLARSAGEGGEALAERAQSLGELSLVVSLVDMRVPPPQPDRRKPDACIATNQASEPRRLPREPSRQRSAVVGALSVLLKAPSSCARAVRPSR